MKVLDAKGRYYSVREAAREIGVSIPRVHQYIAAGKIGAVRMGFVYAIPEGEVLKVKTQPRLRGRPRSK